jgi:ribosomal subunit interface protein
MQIPLQITFRDLDRSLSVEDKIREKFSKLDKYYHLMTYSRVVLGLEERRKHQGNLHKVAIYVALPGKDVVVSHRFNENLYIAIQESMDDLWRQLEEYHSRLYGDTKSHGDRLQGEIVRLIETDGFGFIADKDNNEYYFDLSYLVDTKFHDLRVGERVRFLPVRGNEGLQARRVSVPKRHHRALAP